MPATAPQQNSSVHSWERNDGVGDPFAFPSSRDCGLRRLLLDNIMELQVTDEVVGVVPIENPQIEGGVVCENRENLKSRLKKRLINAKSSRYTGLSNEEKDKLFDNTICERHVVQGDRKWFTEFHGTVPNFQIERNTRRGLKQMWIYT